jgi:GT2 family glycosyltransferase
MISVVIPTYNRCEAVLVLLSTIYTQTGSSFEVLVVDDGSDDATVDEIRRQYPATIILENITNIGPAASRNRGILASSGIIIVGLDSDTSISDTSLFWRIKEFFEQHDGADCAAFRILNPDGVTEDVERWWHPLPVGNYWNVQFLSDYFSGTGYAIRKHAAVGSGLFPEHFFMHYEEVQLAWRLIDRGCKILYVPDLTVIHHVNPVSTRNTVEVFFKPRNQLLLAIGCLPLGAAVYYALPRVFFQFTKAAHRGHLREFFLAMRSASCQMPSLIRTRQPVQRQTIRRMKSLRNSCVNV